MKRKVYKARRPSFAPGEAEYEPTDIYNFALNPYVAKRLKKLREDIAGRQDTLKYINSQLELAKKTEDIEALILFKVETEEELAEFQCEIEQIKEADHEYNGDWHS
jgi:hypothetical protein